MRLLLIILTIITLNCFGQADDNKKSTNDSINNQAIKPAPKKAETDTLPALKLTALQIQDIQSYQQRVENFKIRVESESDALGREYRAMMHGIIHANNIADYVDWYLEPDKLNVIVPKKKTTKPKTP